MRLATAEVKTRNKHINNDIHEEHHLTKPAFITNKSDTFEPQESVDASPYKD